MRQDARLLQSPRQNKCNCKGINELSLRAPLQPSHPTRRGHGAVVFWLGFKVNARGNREERGCRPIIRGTRDQVVLPFGKADLADATAPKGLAALSG